jgi:hypothetical protein
MVAVCVAAAVAATAATAAMVSPPDHPPELLHIRIIQHAARAIS